MKITFKWWSFWKGQQRVTVDLPLNQTGYPKKKAFKELIETMKQLKNVEVKED